MRLRKDWLEFQKLRRYIDDMERMFVEDVYIEDGVENCGCGCEKCKCVGTKCGGGDHEGSKEEGRISKSGETKKGNESSQLEKEIKKIQKMYNDLMETIETNQPDFYSAAPISKGSKH